MTGAEAARVAEQLDLDIEDVPICLACLGIVSMALDTGDERRIVRATCSMTPDLWAEGLELPAWAALERARERGVPNASAALDDVAARGAGGVMAQAVVRRLAGQLAERTGNDPLKMGWRPWPPPDPCR